MAPQLRKAAAAAREVLIDLAAAELKADRASLSVKDGMVIDFTDLKNIIKKEVINRFDHALVLNGNSPHNKIEVLHQQFNKIILVPFQPSCENLLIEIKNTLVGFFNAHHQLISLRLDETPTSYAEWHFSDNQNII